MSKSLIEHIFTPKEIKTKIGTVICLFLVGPVAGFFLPRSEKLITSIIENTYK